jgi:hypothetical protein
MAKPDMSRNKDLAGKTVSKGGYNISYNENGYATSAIKTGSKTGKAAAPSADTVGGGGSDRGSYGGSVYDQEHFSNDELRSAAEVRAAAAAGKTTWADAHDYVERIRSNYGYSGDSDGSRYIPLEMGGGGRGNGGGGFSYEAAPTYTSRYQSQIDDLTRQILNREAFSYDPEKDPTYQQYKESYTRSGERAMQDTLGQVSARTGGLASSYAGSAAQQTYDNYMGALADKIPELKQLAYSMYQDEGNTQRANLEMLVALEQGDYAKYADLLAQYNTDRSFDYGVHRDNISDERYNNEWNYSVGRDQIADKRYEDETAYNRETYKDETEYNRALAKAQTLAAGGDFSGYKALGYTDQEIAGLKSAYNKAQASARSGKSGGTGGKGGDVYSQMYNAGVRSYDDAYAWLRAAGYGTTDANRYANGLVNKIKSGDFESSGNAGSGSGGKTSLDWDQDEGIFTWNGKQYNSVTSLAAAIDSAGLSDEEKRTVERKFKLFGFDISFS